MIEHLIERARAAYLTTLRDYFAAHAVPMSTVSVKAPDGSWAADPPATAAKAYAIADELMRARGRR